MTTVIIKSDSESKTDLLLKLAEELGLSSRTEDFKELDSKALAFGIGRKATDEEWDHYLAKNKDAKDIDWDEAFPEYSDPE